MPGTRHSDSGYSFQDVRQLSPVWSPVSVGSRTRRGAVTTHGWGGDTWAPHIQYSNERILSRTKPGENLISTIDYISIDIIDL